MTDAIPPLRETPKLSVGTKLSYGVGSIAVGVSVLGLSATLLQPYLNRVIGLPALWVGTAIMLTLMLDAVIDPAIGQWSDKLRTRWGRRHPLMYASAPLIAVACIAFWNSPSTWPVTTTGIFVISMLVLLRLCVSLYEIPSSALAPELTSDYHQRTSLFSYRFFFGVLGGLGMNVVLYQVFLSPAAGGILNKAGYANFGILAAGVMAGFPVVDVKVRVVDGSYHEVDSNEMAFKIAGSMGFKEGFMRASPVLLEPIMKVEVVTPEGYMGDVMGDISRRRGILQGSGETSSGKVINSIVPLGEMFGYATSLRSMSQGRATFAMEFDHYAEAPANIADAVMRKL